VYALPVADVSSKTSLTALEAKVSADLVVHTGSLSSYTILDVSGFKHHRVNHAKQFVEGRGVPINGIENAGTSPNGSLENTM